MVSVRHGFYRLDTSEQFVQKLKGRLGRESLVAELLKGMGLFGCLGHGQRCSTLGTVARIVLVSDEASDMAVGQK